MAGRPKIEVNWAQAEKMASIHCTGEEIANVLGFSYDTLERRIKEDGWVNFAEWFKRHSATGKMSLRRMQFELAKKGNATMQIWLGKNYLGQVDHHETTITNREIKVDVFSNENPLRKNDKADRAG